MWFNAGDIHLAFRFEGIKDRVHVRQALEFSQTKMFQSLADDEIMSDELRTRIAMKYVWVARKVRPPRSYKLLWGRMRFGAHRRGKGGKQWLKRFSECWTRCKLCRDKIKPLEIYPDRLCFLCTYLSVGGLLGCNLTPAPILPLWDSDPSEEFNSAEGIESI